MAILLVDTVKRVYQKTSDLKYLLFELLTETVTMLWFVALATVTATTPQINDMIG